MPSQPVSPIDHVRARAIRSSVQAWMVARHLAKTEKLASGDPSRATHAMAFQPQTWLADAARRAPQIQAVTHALKLTHPDARGTSVYVRPAALPTIDAVGTHALGDDYAIDVVGNAAALDVAAFFAHRFEGRTLLELATARDADLLAALSELSEQAEHWVAAYAAVASPRGSLSGHALGKQVFWLVGDDPCDSAAFEQLLILTPTSLVHRLYVETQADRFGDDAKAARAARRAGRHDERPVRIYDDLAIQQLGGTKPQNLSQLNSQRRGQSPLLASLPPVWRSDDIRPIYGPTSVFSVIGRRSDVNESLDELVATLTELLAFLNTDPARTKATRDRRDASIDRLIDEFIAFSGQFEALPAGWTQDARCRLPDHERRWLDPWADRAAVDSAEQGDARDEPGNDPYDQRFELLFGVEEDDVDRIEADDSAPVQTPARPDGPVHPVVRDMAAGFANWLNARIEKRVGPVGEPEAHHWRRQALRPFREFWEERA